MGRRVVLKGELVSWLRQKTSIEGGNDQLSQPAHLHVVQAAELEPLVRLLVELDGDPGLDPCGIHGCRPESPAKNVLVMVKVHVRDPDSVREHQGRLRVSRQLVQPPPTRQCVAIVDTDLVARVGRHPDNRVGGNGVPFREVHVGRPRAVPQLDLHLGVDRGEDFGQARCAGVVERIKVGLTLNDVRVVQRVREGQGGVEVRYPPGLFWDVVWVLHRRRSEKPSVSVEHPHHQGVGIAHQAVGGLKHDQCLSLRCEVGLGVIASDPVFRRHDLRLRKQHRPRQVPVGVARPLVVPKDHVGKRGADRRERRCRPGRQRWRRGRRRGRRRGERRGGQRWRWR
mmetsp:Transcript_31845/g.94654  ORF Transcript_31845/g.94654 Transcript_31845/m.94654 type:complete len:340 (+) Transcript_31845:519-1538(+)